MATEPRPNVLFIHADDWGWGDLACHGHPIITTPNLDRLAKQGTDYHRVTVCNPVCSPGRTAIVAGQFPARQEIHQHFAGHQEKVARGVPGWLNPQAAMRQGCSNRPVTRPGTLAIGTYPSGGWKTTRCQRPAVATKRPSGQD